MLLTLCNLDFNLEKCSPKEKYQKLNILLTIWIENKAKEYQYKGSNANLPHYSKIKYIHLCIVYSVGGLFVRIQYKSKRLNRPGFTFYVESYTSQGQFIAAQWMFKLFVTIWD